MNCPNCGYELQPLENQCPICLTIISETPYPTTQTQQYGLNYNESNYPNSTSTFSSQYASRYDPTPKADQSQIVMPTIIQHPELKLGKYHKKGYAVILSVIMCLLGALFGYIFFDLLDLIPIMGIIIVYILFILPLISTITIGLGFYRLGGILLIIGSIIIIPIGLIGIYGGLIALKLAKVRDIVNTKKPNIDPSFSNKFQYPNKPIKVIGILLIIICLVIPGIYFSYYLSQPQLRIASDEINVESGYDFIIDIKNVGYSTAKSEDITIETIGDNNKIERFRWTEGDIESGETYSIQISLANNVPITGYFKIAIYYKEIRTDLDTFEWKTTWN